MGASHRPPEGGGAPPASPARPPPPVAATGPPTRKGYLEKQAPGRAAKWDRRYFELTASGSMDYYKKEGGRNVGNIFLKGCPVGVAPDDPCIFFVQSEDRTYTLRAESATEAKRWRVDIEWHAKGGS